MCIPHKHICRNTTITKWDGCDYHASLKTMCSSSLSLQVASHHKTRHNLERLLPHRRRGIWCKKSCDSCESVCSSNVANAAARPWKCETATRMQSRLMMYPSPKPSFTTGPNTKSERAWLPQLDVLR